MALQIRRGTNTQRQALGGVNTPIAGELLYSTDNKKLHIGDGTTTGGTSIGYFGSVAVSGQSTIKSTGVNEALTIVAGANISLTTDANTGTLTIAAAPQELNNGSLRLFQNNISSINSNEDINIDPSGTGTVVLPSGRLYVKTTSYSADPPVGITLAQHHSTVDAVNMSFFRTRGTDTAPTVVLDGDDLSDIAYWGHDGTNRVNGATFSAIVEGSPVTGHVPTKFRWQTNNGFGNSVRAEISSGGAFKTNNIQNYSGAELNISGTGTVTATNSIIGNGAASPAAGTILTINGTVSGGSLVAGSIFGGGTVIFGTRITAVNSATFTSTISTTTMTVASVSVGTITVGMALSGGSVTPGTYVVAFVSGINGGAGIYTLNQSATGTPTTGRSYTVSGASQLVRSTTITSGGNINMVGNVRILGQQSLRFTDVDSSNYVAFQAPATVASNITWILPSTIGNAGQVLTATGQGILQWSLPELNNGSLRLFQNNITGLNSNEDIVIAPSGTGGVKIDKVAAPTTTTTASSIGYLGMPVSTVTTTGTLTLADAGKHVYVNTTSQTITIPANSTVAYPIGTTIAFIAGPSATTVTIAIASDTMYLAGPGTTGSRTLAAFGMATAVKIASTSWIINGTGLT